MARAYLVKSGDCEASGPLKRRPASLLVTAAMLLFSSVLLFILSHLFQEELLLVASGSAFAVALLFLFVISFPLLAPGLGASLRACVPVQGANCPIEPDKGAEKAVAPGDEKISGAHLRRVTPAELFMVALLLLFCGACFLLVCYFVSGALSDRTGAVQQRAAAVRQEVPKSARERPEGMTPGHASNLWETDWRMGLLALEQRRYSDAEMLLLGLLKELTNVQDGGTSLASCLRALADTYVEQGKYREAEVLARRAVETVEKSLGPEDPELDSFLHTLTVILDQLGKYGEAEAVARRAVRLLEKARGGEDADLALWLDVLAGISLRQNKISEAEMLARRAAAIAIKTQSGYLILCLRTLARIAFALRKFEEAERTVRKAIELNQQYAATTGFEAEDPVLCDCLEILSFIYMKQGKHADAEAAAKRAAEISEKLYGPAHPFSARYRTITAGACLNQGKYAEAEEVLRGVLSITETTRGPDDPILVDALTVLALTYDAQDRYPEAAIAAQRALSIINTARNVPHLNPAFDRDMLRRIANTEQQRGEGSRPPREPITPQEARYLNWLKETLDSCDLTAKRMYDVLDKEPLAPPARIRSYIESSTSFVYSFIAEYMEKPGGYQPEYVGPGVQIGVLVLAREQCPARVRQAYAYTCQAVKAFDASVQGMVLALTPPSRDPIWEPGPADFAKYAGQDLKRYRDYCDAARNEIRRLMGKQ